jgi:hypothetical protein
MARRIQNDPEAQAAVKLLATRGYSLNQVRWAYNYLRAEDKVASMTAAYRGDGMSFEDDGSPEHDD